MGRKVVYRSPTVIVEFELDFAGISLIAVDAPLRQAVHDVAEHRAMPFAVSISPVRTGEYARSWQVDDSQTIVNGMRRVAAILANVSDHAAAVEWGNEATKGNGHEVLRKTLEYLDQTSL